MSVRKKGRRKIIYDNNEYVWYVSRDDDSPYLLLNIVSADKSLILSVPLHIEKPYIISKGKIFQSAKTNGCWNRYLLPFDIPQVITSKFVAALIAWATEEPNADKAEYNGSDIII